VTLWIPHLGGSLRILGRFVFPALAGILAAFVLAPLSCAESLNITSAPAGANGEIDGALLGTTPFHTDYPGGYFHKTHTVFGSRLEHAMTLRVSKDGYAAQQITITDGPYGWLAVNGKHQGDYFVLKSDHFDMKLTAAAEIASTTWAGDARVGPMHPHAVAAASSDDGETAPGVGVGTVAILSDATGAEDYVDGHFVGQTPATLHLASGAHRIELRAGGKRDWSREIDVIRDSEVTVRPVMERVQ
jgi:hypothetical protein